MPSAGAPVIITESGDCANRGEEKSANSRKISERVNALRQFGWCLRMNLLERFGDSSIATPLKVFGTALLVMPSVTDSDLGSWDPLLHQSRPHDESIFAQ